MKKTTIQAQAERLQAEIEAYEYYLSELEIRPKTAAVNHKRDIVKTLLRDKRQQLDNIKNHLTDFSAYFDGVNVIW